MVHVDVMDGHFVPNLTFGVPVVAALKARTRLPLDVHLMVSNPDRLLDDYLAAGADRLAVHWEACVHLDRTLRRIRAAGAKAGVAINPATPVELLVDVLDTLDFVLLMSVNPGFAGQAFLPGALGKARRLKELAAGRPIEIAMDGGLGPTNLAAAAAAGVDVAVVGSAVYGSPDPVAALGALRTAPAGGTR